MYVILWDLCNLKISDEDKLRMDTGKNSFKFIWK